VASKTEQPVLIYDGDCGICIYWVNFWKKLTGNTIDYRPYQEVASDYPDISIDAFKQSIQFIDQNGTRSEGAKATCKLLKDVPAYSLLYRMYKYIPGFSRVSEWGYTFFSRRRNLLKWVSYIFWGKTFEPPRYEMVTWIFLRCLGLIYFSAFVSFGIQVLGLIGSEGILPLDDYLTKLYLHFDNQAYLKVPTIFWFNENDYFLQLICLTGAILSIFLIINVLVRPSLVVLYILYLSLYHAGQDFMTFQWDLLLLEAGFLAIFLPTRSHIIIWLYRWLAFRFMFLGGVVKITSRDPTWDNLTALLYHFETQPLPTPLAWYVHYLPDAVNMTLTGLTLFIELFIPFLIFLPRRIRFIAGLSIIALQITIILSGNYNFFNLLTLAFCLFLFDDASVRSILPIKIVCRLISTEVRKRLPITNVITATAVGMLIMLISTTQLLKIFTTQDQPFGWSVLRALHSFNIVNTYGPFAIMTTRRIEIVIEGSNNKRDWFEYEFKYKPGDVFKPARWIIPHQPRLDWQMWFAALTGSDRVPWFSNLLYRLLLGNSDVTKLFKVIPFAETPPKYIRALSYQYHFSEPVERNDNGQWWIRELTGVYYKPVSLPASE
jgi:predicted DCC family thiol-disulfide oxidoreductase YuxK